jgi:RHS repeat-associated protein
VNNSNISSTEIYNNRLQPCWMYTTSGTALPTSSSCTGTATTGNFQDLKYNFAWGVSDNGNVMGITNNRDTTRSQVFAYDALNRLQSANTASTYATSPTHCWGESYGIDGWSNLQALAMLNSQYTGCNQESSFSVTASVQNQLPISGNTYDSAGNLGVGMVGGIPYTYTYTYNAENQMTSVTGLSTTTSYLYDGEGKRVEKTGSKIYSYGPEGSVLDETDATGSFTNANFSEYIYFGGKRIARRDSSGDVFYYFADHLGTSRTMAQVPSGQTTGTLCYDADFYPFGGERAYTNICTQNYKFTGKERDSESGLDYFGARYNASSLGRMMSADSGVDQHPEDPQSWNVYAYGRNNPLVMVDPTGEYVCGSGVTQTMCDNFQKELDSAQHAANALKDTYGADSTQYKDAQRAIDAYGKEGVDNGVTVQVGYTGGYPGAVEAKVGSVTPTNDNPYGMRVTVDFRKEEFSGNADNGIDVAHEGSHVADESEWVASSFATTMNLTKYQTENRALHVEASIVESMRYPLGFMLGKTPQYIWKPGWTPAMVDSAINWVIKSSAGPYHVTPDDRVLEFKHNTKGGQ